MTEEELEQKVHRFSRRLYDLTQAIESCQLNLRALSSFYDETRKIYKRDKLRLMAIRDEIQVLKIGEARHKEKQSISKEALKSYLRKLEPEELMKLLED